MPEAAQLILYTSTFKESSNTFLLDMGKPIKILNLVKKLINYFAENPKSIKIIYTKLLKSEKLNENLIHNETKQKTIYKKIFKIKKKIKLEKNYYNNIYKLSNEFTENYNKIRLKQFVNSLKKNGIKIADFL